MDSEIQSVIPMISYEYGVAAMQWDSSELHRLAERTRSTPTLHSRARAKMPCYLLEKKLI
jgi:hypothetical protein